MILQEVVGAPRQRKPIPARDGDPRRRREPASFLEDGRRTVGSHDSDGERRGEKQERQNGEKPTMSRQHV